MIHLTFPDGSIGSIAYLANGDKSVPKERVEVFCGGNVAILDDFRQLELVSGGRRNIFRSPLGQDKGHRGSWAAFLQAVREGAQPPISYRDQIGVTRATFAVIQSLAENRPVEV